MTRAMAIKPQKTTAIFEEMDKMRRAIMQRAFDLSSSHGGSDFDNWIAAEAELTWKPAIEVSEGEKQVVVRVAMAGVSAKDIELLVTPEDALIRAEVHHEHTKEDGAIHMCEFRAGKLFRGIRFPRAVDSDKVKADYKDGLLTLRAPWAKEKRGLR